MNISEKRSIKRSGNTGVPFLSMHIFKKLAKDLPVVSHRHIFYFKN